MPRVSGDAAHGQEWAGSRSSGMPVLDLPITVLAHLARRHSLGSDLAQSPGTVSLRQPGNRGLPSLSFEQAERHDALAAKPSVY